MDKMEAKDALRELMKRRITNTFKKALDHAESLIGPEFFDDFRHTVLDCGNDQIRMLMDDLDKFDVQWGGKREIFIGDPKYLPKHLKEENNGNR